MIIKKFISSSSSEVDEVRKSMLPIEDLKNFSQNILTALLERAGKHKDTLMDAVSSEVAKFLTKVNVAEEVRKILEGMTIRFEATVNYDQKPNSNKSGLKVVTRKKTLVTRVRKTKTRKRHTT